MLGNKEIEAVSHIPKEFTNERDTKEQNIMTLWIKSNKEHRKKTLLERTDYSCFSFSSNNIPDREETLNACVRNQHLLSLIRNNYFI